MFRPILDNIACVHKMCWGNNILMNYELSWAQTLYSKSFHVDMA